MKESNLTLEMKPRSNAKYWTDNQMRAGEWYKVKPLEIEIFKILIDERYGWPGYVLNFDAAMENVMKVKTMI